jgi:arabinan endo-1,5-alpha-L-arabinosidase
VIRRDGWYYLFYSGDNCCGPKAHYAVFVARSRSATGPFELRPDPILVARDNWVAPGHNSVIEDARGAPWILYHAVDSNRPRSKPSDELNTRRVMLIDRLVWRDGWPVVAGPTGTAQPRPAIKP